MTGTSTETATMGSGSGTESCNGAGVSYVCNVIWNGVGTVTVKTGSCWGSDGTNATMEARCDWVPTNLNPTTAYDGECEYAFA
jgi:hypothetical protein